MTGYRQQKPRFGLTKCPDLVDHYILPQPALILFHCTISLSHVPLMVPTLTGACRLTLGVTSSGMMVQNHDPGREPDGQSGGERDAKCQKISAILAQNDQLGGRHGLRRICLIPLFPTQKTRRDGGFVCLFVCLLLNAGILPRSGRWLGTLPSLRRAPCHRRWPTPDGWPVP